MTTLSRRFLLSVLFLASLTASPLAKAAGPAANPAESRTQQYFESIRKDPNLLLAFLREMPKGGDLHNHLAGSIYAESLIQWAGAAGDCVDPQTLILGPGPCNSPNVAAANGLADPALYGKMIDAFSMRNWQYSGQSGHDHFFDTFGKFGQATRGTTGKMLAETASRAASQHEVYQELMHTPTGKELDDLAKSVGWDDDFSRMQQKLLAGGLPQLLAQASQQLSADEASRDRILQCGTPAADPGCQVEQRYLFQVARGRSREIVFAEILSGFLLTGADPAVVPPNPHMVGLNLVMPEDWYVPMKDFSLQMRMLDYLHRRYPQVHISLHAGELVEGLVPPEGLRFHIRDSVEIGHAERIGHGVDVMNEKDPAQLLREMADRKVMVEICLTSNDVILGVSGAQHPLSAYLRAGVPVALGTDDEGVARSDMTHEYLRGAEAQNLSYTQLKKMARTSLEYAFVPGTSLWRDGNTFVVIQECSRDLPGKAALTACQKVLDGSDKARLQWKLEGQFREFEARPWKQPTSLKTSAKTASR